MSRFKFALAIIANYLPVVCAPIFYSGGALLNWMVFLLLHIILFAMNFNVSDGRKTLLILSANLLVSTYAAHYLVWFLYARNICDDIVGAALSLGGRWIGIALVLIVSMIMIALKKKPASSDEEQTEN